MSATKSNGIIHTMPFWDEVMAEVAAGTPGLSLENVLIDALAARLVLMPHSVDVIVASNLFGDILSDLAAAVARSIGVAPSANLNPPRRYPSMFEPVHGSAPDIAGQGVANPVGQMWAVSMMLDHLGEKEAATALVAAFGAALAAGVRTRDLGGTASTEEFTQVVLRHCGHVEATSRHALGTTAGAWGEAVVHPRNRTFVAGCQRAALDNSDHGLPHRRGAVPDRGRPSRTDPGPNGGQRRARAIEDPAVQGLRAVLCSEPRGHADMYRGFIVPPDDEGADLGVLFWHKDGFSTACGHGTIALGVWAVETGRVAAPETGSADVVIDVPSGRVTARVHREDARVVAVDFVNVPSWVVARDVPVTTSLGEVRMTVACGGAIYATLPATQLGLTVTPERLRHGSIVGSTFTGTVLDTVDVDGRPAVIPQVTGTVYRTGEHVFSIDPYDPLVPGFVLR